MSHRRISNPQSAIRNPQSASANCVIAGVAVTKVPFSSLVFLENPAWGKELGDDGAGKTLRSSS
jgi:hypothetical protein